MCRRFLPLSTRNLLRSVLPPLAAALAVATTTPASSQTVRPADTGAAKPAALTTKSMLARSSAARAHVAAKRMFASPDVTPPVLNSISVTGAPDMSKSSPSVTVTLDISDDLTGFYNGVVYLQSPAGELIAQQFNEGNAPRHVVHKEQMGYPRGGGFNPDGGDLFDHWSQPGTWTVYEVILVDVAGNEVSYTGDQLAALGNLSFNVKNANYDGIPPVLIGGQILTPVVSLSKGNDHGIPLVKATVSMTDTGTDVASGVDYVAMFYCLPPVDINNQCADYLSTYTSLGVPASAVNTTVTTSNIAYSWNVVPTRLATPGVYQLAQIIFSTLDGSNASWTSSLIGGTTDFNQYFPSTTVTVTP